MTDRIARDRLIVKLFYTACCGFVCLVVVPVALVMHDSDKWDPPARVVAMVYLFALTVLMAIWVPPFRRRKSTLPPLEAVRIAMRVIWGLLAAFSGTMIISLSLLFPTTFLFSSTGDDRLVAALVELAGAALIVIFTWDVITGRQPVPGVGEETARPPARGAFP